MKDTSSTIFGYDWSDIQAMQNKTYKPRLVTTTKQQAHDNFTDAVVLTLKHEVKKVKCAHHNHFRKELELNGVAYVDDVRFSIQATKHGGFYVSTISDGIRRDGNIEYACIEAAIDGAMDMID